MAGAPVPVPVYDYVQFNRSGEVRVVHPARIIVVEGILVLWEPSLRERFDLKVFLDTAADLRLIRRLCARRRASVGARRRASSSNTCGRCARPTSSSSSRASATPT